MRRESFFYALPENGSKLGAVLRPCWVLVAIDQGGFAMGWVEQRGKKFRLSFRYGGKMFRHSLGVETQKEADESLALVERNLRLLEEGILELPRGADLPLFLLSGGKLRAKPEIVDVVTLGGLVTLYMGGLKGTSLNGVNLSSQVVP